MNYQEFSEEFEALGNEPTAAELDKFNKGLIRRRICVEELLFYRVREDDRFYRTYMQVSLAMRRNIKDKFEFIENNTSLLKDW